MNQRPFGNRVRVSYYILAAFNILTIAIITYLVIDLRQIESREREANELLAARISRITEVEEVAANVNAPGNDIFASGDIGAEKASLQAAVSKFEMVMAKAREEMGGDQRLSDQLLQIDSSMTLMVQHTETVFQLMGLRQVDKAAASMVQLDRSYAHLRKTAEDMRAGLRSRQLTEFRRQSDHSEQLERLQQFGVGVLSVLAVSLLAYGRRLDREVLTSRERERYLQALQEREVALQHSVAERESQRELLARKQQLLSDGEAIARMGAFELNLLTNQLWWSDEMYRRFGLEPGQLEPSYEAFIERVATRDRERVSEVIGQAIADLARYEMELAVVPPDGTERVLRAVGQVDADSTGRPARIMGVAMDITETKWAEEQLLRQEAQLAEAQRVAHMGSWELDVKTGKVTWSDELHELLGYGSGEVEPSFRAYMTLLPSDEKKRVYGLLEKATTSQENRFEFEHTLVRHNGGEIRMLVRGVIDRDSRGRPVRVLGVSQDITAGKIAEESLRLSEERFQFASRATHDVMWDWNLVTNALWISETFSTQFGYSKWGDIAIDVWYAGIHPDDTERIGSSLHTAIDGTATDWTGQYRFRNGDGVRWHEVLDRGYIVRDANGKGVRMIGAMMDITERRAMERMKDEFISTVSHELRTPLTSIRGALGLLSSGRLGTLAEKGQRLLTIASENTDRLVRLINDILDIERIESGKVTLEKMSCDAAELVRKAVESVRSLADREKIAIHVEATPVPLMADPDRMIQTLTNLLGNAVKFSPAGSTVTVSARAQGNNVILSVADRGRGIPAEKLGAIFERFQQVDASDSRDKGGSGLGLAISRSIVRQHGGEISVESEIGRGSTFTITLPAGLALAAAPAAADDPQQKLVFVCDDDADTRDVLKYFLTERGYRVRNMVTARDLIDAVAVQKPDAILLDLFMPDMNGWETLARLKSDPSMCDIPVIVVSILSPDETGSTGLELSGWVQKPLDERALAGVIERAFRKEKRKPQLMLVEDDEDLASVIKASFERYGIQTIHARNGKEAIEMAGRIEPDLLILDLALPGVDGYGVIDWLKDHEVWRGLPLVVYSATEPSQSQRERLKLGYTEFMTKSRVAPEEFERRIVTLLDTLTTARGGEITHVT